MESVDVVVVGGGFAGLVAAREIQKAGRSVVVLEARERVGGRIKNHVFDDGTVVEAGGAWVGPTQDRVLALIDELGIGLFPTFDDGEGILAIDGAIRRYADESLGFDAATLADVGETQAELEALAATVPTDAPWEAPDARLLDDQTFDAWLVANTKTDGGLRFWRMLVPAIFCAEATQMSLLHGLFYVHSGGMIDRLIATGGGAQESRVVGGTQSIALALADDLGDAVRLEAPVREIRQGDDGVEVDYAGGTIVAERVVVSVPPALAARIRYVPALPALRDQLTQQMPMGFVIKCQVRYATPFWRADGLSGFALSVEDPVSVTFDGSPADGACGVMTAFVEADQAVALTALDADERQGKVIASLVRLYGPAAADPVEYLETNWAEEEWSRGCYVGHLGTGAWTRYAATLREPVGAVHWAGTETADLWNGYMDGAVRSGERAAGEVLAALWAREVLHVNG
ncbi:Putative flavin-containing monoamine oxidase AofH [Baekduia alba]|uniref:flavin monoamine oxidase family protein n=1 Tax=Baekduia alba TaxID=2997333 RepID=UPI0023427B1B|nr:flavin monoamine oxidase family protein [Baekduia alba]WCB93426.1 Putative flavin-containing monoamine oxidase AofH [Baekduia alba]